MQLGPYLITGEVGRGGCGTVYRGRSPDGRDVAIKVLASASPAAAARFERERALLAELGEAEGFVPLLGAGVAAEAGGSAYLVMPFVPGGTLRDKLRGGPLPIEEALAIARRLAETLGRAHARGIVHRDLKPENVLFTAAGSPLVADLGLAKRLAGTPQDGLSLSLSGEFRGTAGYMAPEQMRDSKSAGPPADVFSLGAVLYECLTGTPLFVAENVLDVIDLASSGSYQPLEAVRKDVPRWLRAVVRRCLAREPEARYADGAALRAALGQTASAAGRAPTALAAGALGLVVGLAAGVAIGRSMADAAPPVAPPAVAVTPTPPPPSLPVTAATETPLAGPVEVAAPGPDTPLERDLAASKVLALEALLGDPWAKHTGGVTSLVVGSDSILAGDGHGVVRVWRGDRSTMAVRTGGTGRLIKRLAAGSSAFVDVGSDDTVFHRPVGKRGAQLQHHAGAVHAVATTKDDHFVATGGEDMTAAVWDLERREKVLSAMHDAPVTAVALSEDGDTLLTGTNTGRVALWSIGARRQVTQVNVTGGGAARHVALTPDRARGAVALQSGAVVVVDLATNAALGQVTLEAIPLALGFAEAGGRLVGVDALGVSVWALPGMERVARHAFPERASCAGLARDGGRVAFSPARGAVVLTLDVASGARSEPTPGHLGWITEVASGGDRLWTAGIDFTLRRWDREGHDEVVLQGDSALGAVAAAPDGSVVAVGDTFYAQGPSAPPRGLQDTTTISDLLFAGDRLWVGRDSGMLEAHPTANGPGRVFIPGHTGRVLGLTALPGRGVVSWALEGQGALVRANHPGRALEKVTTRPGRRGALAALPGAGATVVTGDNEGSLRWLDLERGAEALRVKAHAEEVLCVAASPDGRLVASGGFDRALRLWDASTAALLDEVELKESLDLATALVFLPDGRLLVGFGSGAVARLTVR